jgi:acyl-CoA synthetase (AMP-forming)/AMP-acid ligase II
MNLIETFQPSLRGRADQRAIRFHDAWYTFDDLDRESAAVAHALVNDCGVRKGDRVGMFLGNCPELIVFYQIFSIATGS